MKKKVIVVISILVALLCIVTAIFFSINTNPTDNYTLEKISDEFFSVDESIVATVNGEDITNKDLYLVEYFYHPSNTLDTAIEQKAICKLAAQDNFSLSQAEMDKEISYIDKRYEALSLPENEQNSFLKNALRKNYIELVISKAYVADIEMRILHQEFSCDNEKINKKYEKYKLMYEEWENGDKEDSKLYQKIWDIRKEIAQDYIDYETKQFQIEKYK